MVKKQNQLKKINSDQLNEVKELVIQGQTVTHEILYAGFSGLAIQNQQLIDENQKLNSQLESLQEQFQVVFDELQIMKKEREEKARRKVAYINRKRLPQRDPITPEIYKLLIETVPGPDYVSIRTRIALCLLTVTGVRISELLPIKVSQLDTLRNHGWISIDRLKRGPSNHKAFLTKEGKKLIQDRSKDFQIMFLMKEPDSYVFSSEKKHKKIVRREVINKSVNNVTRHLSETLPNKPNITSHSFRVGYITQLWKDSNDIEFVRQSIGHRKLDTTSVYVTELSEQERQKRISEI